ncbi:hypothetical protein with predicted heme-binding domain [Arabidopsis thaliana]|uniref:Transmembrane protein n=2 Tax=Arabidopsis thaliana TaxID=3702 RepID=O22237_ARATH|nr:uncharacterized protein AT3G44760 [Arabidopsis thaliana]AAB70031.1 hypothetical protein with predicted heme-binding domain [Arabidopsis thaliana]AAV68860.1 hypothetical protein AT3G44760 [Arabidopsis thaliana]AAX23858.1 hypothetical protein At3g44760 [Arabidopsis thaliana]AEE77947.1 transmembrane protein [Arabidopsis thaliana]CAA0384498.1 unnamed protein product [Arabidopsis thaliana]|eukprot:NP_190062.1 transmembrane protein [Arabidopsis thaliana]
MKKLGLTCRWIASDAVFNKLSLKFNVLVVVTLMLLRIWGESNFIDFVNFEISKVTFREAMGLLTLMMAYFYYLGSLRWIVSELLELNDPLVRIEKRVGYDIWFLDSGLLPREPVWILLGNFMATSFSSEYSFGYSIRQVHYLLRISRLDSLEMKIQLNSAYGFFGVPLLGLNRLVVIFLVFRCCNYCDE